MGLGRGLGLTVALGLLGAACGDATQGSNDDEGTADETTGPPPTTSTTATSTTDPSTSGTVTTMPPPMTDNMVPVCGDGMVEAPEECDDGNEDPGDGCEADCTETVDTQQWEDIFGGDASVQESGNDVAFDGAGNAYVIGYVVDDVGNPDIWLRKYTPEGAEDWTQTYDPSTGFDDRGYGVDIDPDGNILVAGDVGDADGGSSIWYAKLDDTGVITWFGTVDGPNAGADVGNAVASDGSGNVVVAGYVRVANGDNDIWVGKYDPDGGEMWTDTIPGPDGLDDRAEGVAVDADDNIIAAGYISNEGLNKDVWIRKFPPGGGETWTTVYDSVLSGSESSFGVDVASDGSVGVAGTTPINADNDNVWLGRFDADGELVWQKEFGGPAIEHDRAFAVAIDSQDNFLVVGFKGITTTDTDIWMRLWDDGGNVVWTQLVIGAGGDRDQALGVAADGNDDFVVTGEIRTEANNNGDIWVAKLGGSP